MPQNSAVLFTSLYKDKNNKYVTYVRIKDFFNSSKYPIFAVNKIHLSQGIVGGIMVNPFEQGFVAAKKTIEIIDGAKANELKIETIHLQQSNDLLSRLKIFFYMAKAYTENGIKRNIILKHEYLDNFLEKNKKKD